MVNKDSFGKVRVFVVMFVELRDEMVVLRWNLGFSISDYFVSAL